ncbi:hypothetical protein ACFQ9Z_16490 [Streptomyces sp. NPDC056580]|uniref:hypothetical protein n=1 Tax=Streptomyces sp. NPDC056580 TaxID=3345872 RepID=UPI0036A61407
MGTGGDRTGDEWFAVEHPEQFAAVLLPPNDQSYDRRTCEQDIMCILALSSIGLGLDAAVADSLKWAILKVSNALNVVGVCLVVRSVRGMNHERPPVADRGSSAVPAEWH